MGTSERFRSWLDLLKQKAGELKRETIALGFACRDERTPWYAKALAVFILAYALSPIDLIPDFIPVLGYLDDLVIVPAGIALALRMIPPEVMQSAREQAGRELAPGSRLARWGTLIVILVWLLLLALIGWLGWSLVKK